MEERDIALRITGVRKRYRLGSISSSTLQAELQSWWARVRGAEDPNTRIGASADSVGKTFWALDGIDLTVYRGERVGIIGANGAGKSTLLKLLSRITAPTEGELEIWGRVSSMLEVGTGFHREMTGRENIYMNGAILGMTRAEIDARMEDIIDFSEIREFIDTPVKRYSSGMFVKLAFSVAAHLSSEILVMDEVLAVGDMAFQYKCLSKMREAADAEGRTVLYVSHNMSTIRRLCDRCVVLDRGRVIFDGAVEEAIAAYMNSSLGDNEVDMPLDDRPRSRRSADTALRMTRLTLSDRVTPVYGAGEPLRIRLAVETTEALSDVILRLTLRTDSDVGVGTSWSEPTRFDGPGAHILTAELPLDTLAKGMFYASIGLYRSDELGRPVVLDHISHAFRFELMGSASWNAGAYGYVRLPGVRLIG